MPNCNATTKLGAPCRNKCKGGSTHCGIHSRLQVLQVQQNTPIVHEHTCECVKVTGVVCGKGAGQMFHDRWTCKYHNTLLRKTWYRENAMGIRAAAWEAYQTTDITLNTLYVFVEGALQRGEIDHGWLMVLFEQIEGFEMLDAMMHNGPPPRARRAAQQQPPQPQTIGTIALDPQSVHTAVVSEQTNRTMDILLAEPVSSDCNTLKELPIAFHLNRKLYSDMRRWYKQSTCRGVDDWLYRKALDGLWALIQRKEGEEREELVQRLFEEAKESIGMCCEGHISRLCNVMVGFDDRFAAAVSVGEQLQMRMAAIANEDLATELKVERAVGVFRELAVPEDQWDAWIEAF